MEDNIFLALGSNRGDRLYFIRESIKRIDENDRCEVVKCSSIYETTPYGKIDQPDFLNSVIRIRSEYNAEELLHFLKEMEKQIGRPETGEKWGQREIDVDIIFYNDVIYTGDKIVLPHPEFLKRDFVIIPLMEIAPDFIHPVLKKRIDNLDLSKIEKHIARKIEFQLIK
ncbi:MAG: 2-amino-4-hydroxy-6-hydroxymethyldihydropteridine diphosphokinase [Ignavibacteriae bacterium HGW-Ignavibacteriae-3]|nr:MAG: 2-amino-4-hydroxy-6-hydroxymethyldihydropteridine diphosphokinase [Ignavibacteriae bacterium HGW-Ignavibacteriae-3]